MSPFNSKKKQAFRGYPKPEASFNFLADLGGMTFCFIEIFPKNLVLSEIRGYLFHNLKVVMKKLCNDFELEKWNIGEMMKNFIETPAVAQNQP